MKQLKIHPKIDGLKRWQVVAINVALWIVAIWLLCLAIITKTNSDWLEATGTLKLE